MLGDAEYKLTNDDRRDVLAGCSMYTDHPVEFRRVEREVTRFLQAGFHVPLIVLWTCQILTDMTDGCFDPDCRFNSVEEIRAAFEGAVEEAWQEHQAWLEDDEAKYAFNMTYREYHKHRNLDEHPWEDEVVDDGRRWLAETPYQVWKAVNTIEEAVAETARDLTYDMVYRNDKGTGIAEAAEKKRREVVEALKAKYKAARKAEQDWDGDEMPLAI